MTAALSRPAAPACWAGDPLVLVYAVRHALTLPGGHQVRFVQQAVALNAALLSRAGRLVIVRDVRAWLDDDGAAAPAEDRDAWTAVIHALGGSL